MNHLIPQEHYSTFDTEASFRLPIFAMTLRVQSSEIYKEGIFEGEQDENPIERLRLSHSGNVEEIMFRHAMREKDTFSRLIFDESLDVLLEALKRSLAVDSSQTTNNLFEIRRLTTLSWERLANLLNVDQKTITIWARGHEITDEHVSHIAKTLSVLRYSDKGDSKLNAKGLDWVCDYVTVFELIKHRQYFEAIRALGPGIGRPQYTKSKLYRIGDSTPIFTHERADGSEEYIPPLDESEPIGQRVRVRKT